MAARRRWSNLLSRSLASIALALAGLAIQRGCAERAFIRDHAGDAGRIAGPEGARVRLVMRGETGLPVIMIHGNPGTAGDFELAQAALQDRRTIAVDRPGYGFSDRPSAAMSPADQAEMIRAAVRAAAAAAPADRVVLAGFSYGGPVVLAWAENHREEVAGIVLLAAIGSPDDPFEISAAQSALAVPLLGPAFAWSLAPLIAPGVVAARYEASFSPSPVDPRALERGKLFFTRPLALMSSAHDWRILPATLPGIAARYGELSMPVEILSADDDTVVSRAHGRDLAGHLANAQLRELPQAGHGLLYTHTATVAGAIRRVSARAVR